MPTKPWPQLISSYHTLLLTGSCFWRLIGFPDRSVSGDSLFGLRFAFSQELVEDDRTKGCGTDTPKGEASDVEDQVTCAHGERHRRRHQVTPLGEVHPTLYPDATSGAGNEPKEYDGKPANHPRTKG